MKKKPLIITVAALAAATALTGVCLWQNTALTVRRYTYENPALPADLDGLKIAVLSDLHSREYGKGHARLAALVEAQRPDLILIPGDLADENTGENEWLTPLLDSLTACAPVYFVAGNHEYNRGGYRAFCEYLADRGVMVLDGEAVPLGSEAFLLGIADQAFYDCSDDAYTSAVLAAAAKCEGRFTLLMAHRPGYISDYNLCGIDLVVAGHAHGGQFCLPFGIPVYAPGEGLFPKYAGGECHKGETVMYVSRGLGASIINFRIFDPPEIMSITLKKTAEDKK